MNYFNSLQQVKGSFLDGSEKKIITDYIGGCFEKRPLSVLDIGIGDGRYMHKVAKELEGVGFLTQVTGIDPDQESCDLVNKLYPSFSVQQERFEDFQTNETFDIVTATHSLYYFDQSNQCLEKMIRLTKRGGLATIVLWSERCAINKLYRPCKDCCKFFTGNGLLTIEEVRKRLQTFEDVKDVQLVYFPGRVFLSSWKNIPEMLSGACTVFSRRMNSQPVLSEHVEHIEKLLSHFNDIEQRVNGVLFIQK